MGFLFSEGEGQVSLFDRLPTDDRAYVLQMIRDEGSYTIDEARERARDTVERAASLEGTLEAYFQQNKGFGKPQNLSDIRALFTALWRQGSLEAMYDSLQSLYKDFERKGGPIEEREVINMESSEGVPYYVAWSKPRAPRWHIVYPRVNPDEGLTHSILTIAHTPQLASRGTPYVSVYRPFANIDDTASTLKTFAGAKPDCYLPRGGTIDRVYDMVTG